MLLIAGQYFSLFITSTIDSLFLHQGEKEHLTTYCLGVWLLRLRQH